ncbi:hypothetical protein [Poriferisphaera sp. WC338]|uniref:hypothetical protein n=1 Tax=Poriferisphaera sp. WC338 TaxID=3425129 RepID=UPI003D81283A
MNNNKTQTNQNEPIQRWTAKRKTAVVPEIIEGTTTPAQVARQHDLTVAEIDKCKLNSSPGLNSV